MPSRSPEGNAKGGSRSLVRANAHPCDAQRHTRGRPRNSVGKQIFVEGGGFYVAAQLGGVGFVLSAGSAFNAVLALEGGGGFGKRW
jgi:hypothetical protein